MSDTVEKYLVTFDRDIYSLDESYDNREEFYPDEFEERGYDEETIEEIFELDVGESMTVYELFTPAQTVKRIG